MRILILGGDGMLGHELLRQWSSRHEVRVTLRQDIAAYRGYNLFNERSAYAGIDVRAQDRILEVIADFVPQIVVNAVGIVKQRPDAKELIPSLEINALLPHRLGVLCRAAGARLIHLSTDCVFSGAKGKYTEEDASDALDVYGRTKFLGEVSGSNCLTLRTSIIGRELSRHSSLVDWFLSQTGTIKGYTKAIYTGFTTTEMARIIERAVQQREASGMYHVSSEPITKYELLMLLREKFNTNVEIIPYDGYVCDRSLDSARFRREFKYTPPTWPDMIKELQSLS